MAKRAGSRRMRIVVFAIGMMGALALITRYAGETARPLDPAPRSTTRVADLKSVRSRATAPTQTKPESRVQAQAAPAAAARSLAHSAQRTPASGVRFPRPAPDPYAALPILSFEESRRSSEGEFTRKRVVRSAMKYPLLLIEERYAPDPSTGQDRLRDRVAMVADHLLVKINPGYALQDLERLARQNGGRVKNQVSPETYLVGFENHDVSGLGQMISAFRKSKVVAYPEPDFVVRN